MNLLKKTYHRISYLGIISDTQFIPLQNEPSPILVGPKLGEEIPFESRKTPLFRSAVYITFMCYRKINNYTSRTNKRHKSVDIAWISK